MRKDWKESYDKCKEYYETVGDLNIPQYFRYNGSSIGQFVHNNRQRYRRGKLSQENKELLEEIGIDWNPLQTKETVFLRSIHNYYSKYNDINIPYNYVDKNGVKLGSWLVRQRVLKRKCLISKEIETLLDSMDVVWEGVKLQYSTSFAEQAIFFYVKQLFPSSENGYKLGRKIIDVYIPELKMCIEYDGCTWHTDVKADMIKNIYCEDRGYSVIRVRQCGCPELECVVYNVKDDTLVELGNTISDLLNQLDSVNTVDVDVQRDSEMIRDMYIVSNKSMWGNNILFLRTYFVEHGHCNIPRSFEQEGVKIGDWVNRVRHLYHTGRLSSKQILDLEVLDMKPLSTYWEESFAVAEEYFKEHGDLCVRDDCGIVCARGTLGNWIAEQRFQNRNNKLSSERAAKLNTIGMVWDMEQHRWNENVSLFKEYVSL